MKSERIAGLCLFYEPEEQQSAELIATACEKSVHLIQSRWGLETPRDLRVYVMTSWPKFLFHSAPLLWKGLLAAMFPFYAWRFHVIWPFAGGWFLPFGKRRVVGIKPPHLMEYANLSIGEQFYLQTRDLNDKVETITCHELVHAFTAHLKLPDWLKEGLATLAMDYYLGRQIVRGDTLAELADTAPNYRNWGSERTRIENPRALLFQYICGYWQTRYIDETRPGLIRSLLAQRRSYQELDEMISTSYENEPEKFWNEINGKVRVRFGQG